MSFTKSQEVAIQTIEDFLQNQEQVAMCLSGSPGTGKSYVIQQAVSKLAAKYDLDYIITATTNKASALLEGSTIHSAYGIKLAFNMDTGKYQFDLAKVKDLANMLVVIDEASMLDKKLWDVLKLHSYNCKFLFVGDKYQLLPIGEVFNVFENFPTVELTEVVRQKDPEMLKAISEAKNGVVINKILESIPASTHVHVFTKADAQEMAKIINSFTHNDKILTFTNEKAVNYSNYVRKQKGKTDKLVTGDYVVARNFCQSVKGKQSVYCEQELQISHISEPKNVDIGCIQLELREVEFKDKVGTFLYAPDFRAIKEGKKVLAKLADWPNYFILNEKIVDLRTNEACTTHCAQGSTYNKVFVDLTDIRKCRATSTKTRLLYVALSRAKEEIYLYV